jgi:hypothetical protein
VNPQDLARAIEELILDADSKYASAIGKVQKSLYDQLVGILKILELDSEGYVKQNSINRKILNQADNKINEVFSSSKYTNAINNYISVIPQINLNNVKYFTSIEETFKPSRIFLKNLQADTITTIEKYVLRDGLQSQVINPLSQILSQNINSGGRFSGFLEQIKTYVVGNPDVEGRAMSYTRTYLRDSLFTYSRTFQQSLTSDLKTEFYMYVGGLIETSRPFCIERAGKIFSHKEIESWASLGWSGKKQGTTESSIFLFAAGWNCSHQIIPVSKTIVPKDVLERQ